MSALVGSSELRNGTIDGNCASSPVRMPLAWPDAWPTPYAARSNAPATRSPTTGTNEAMNQTAGTDTEEDDDLTTGMDWSVPGRCAIPTVSVREAVRSSPSGNEPENVTVTEPEESVATVADSRVK